MKIVNIIGGLGNQMFEYAFYLALKNAHTDEPVKCCTRGFKGYGLHNGLELTRIFDIQIEEASLWELCKVAYPFFNYKSWQVMEHFLPKRKSMTTANIHIPFKPEEITRKDSAYYDGYWQNEKNFKSIRQQILATFKFPSFVDIRNVELAEKLIKAESVSCHIRRGDYLNYDYWCVCTPKYYENAIAELKKRTKIEVMCVFSDDIPWCKENLQYLAKEIDIVYVDWNKGQESFRDMQLMTHCKHNIIANSSFSWWGAWLGDREGKIVCAPEAWVDRDIPNEPMCDDWIRVPFK